MDHKNTFIDWRGTDKILVGTLQMSAEECASLRFVRFVRGLAKIVAHAPENVESGNIQHYGVEWKVKKAEKSSAEESFDNCSSTVI